jgi:hypothetical protein
MRTVRQWPATFTPRVDETFSPHAAAVLAPSEALQRRH